MLLKAHEDTRKAPDPVAAVEMALIRLCYAADLPGPEEALKRLQSGESFNAPSGGGGAAPNGGGGGARAASGGASYVQPQGNLRPASQIAAQTVLQSFQDVVKLIDAKRDVVLKLDVDRFVRLVDFKPGQITFATADGAPANLTQRLAGRLKEWTGRPWTMVIEGGGAGAETQYEREQREAAAFRAEIEAHPTIMALKATFPGAEIVRVKRAKPDEAAEVEPAPDEGEDD
jgi:DNA polymerase-3 subunit gamma/tau